MPLMNNLKELFFQHAKNVALAFRRATMLVSKKMNAMHDMMHDFM
jgi:hypothetical protein